jgi:hypothetical protein
LVAGSPISAAVGLRLDHLLEEDGALFCRYVSASTSRDSPGTKIPLS